MKEFNLLEISHQYVAERKIALTDFSCETQCKKSSDEVAEKQECKKNFSLKIVIFPAVVKHMN
jgi:hypothetical protein